MQNYKKVNDSGWVTCSNMTAFVGKNEAGKSVTLRGLSKLNPSDGQPYDGLREFPRRRYSDEFEKQDWLASTAEFQFEPGDIKEVETNLPLLKGVTGVVVSRHYSGKTSIEFSPSSQMTDISINVFISHMKNWLEIVNNATAPEDKGEQVKAIKASLVPFLTQKIKALEEKAPDLITSEDSFNEAYNALMQHFNESWEKELFQTIIDELNNFKKRLQERSQIKKAEEWVKKNMPKFLYFDRYDVIESAIDIMHFTSRLKENPNDPKLRTTKCLFQHVGLDLNKIAQLDPSRAEKSQEELRRMADERAIRMSSASAAMTAKFSEWWEQRRHTFRYQIDGKWFRVWVSDDLDPSEIELDQRSAGMQYFFSFYLVFLVEAQGAYRNSIILLDEPGLHYHGTAQQKTVNFLEKLSEENQILYTTHSPFMVDGDHLERVRIVHEDENDGSTKVSEDIWPKDKEALFPLQAGLGYALAQTLFYAKRQFVVEGLTDYTVLKSVNNLLSKKGRTTLSKSAVITPAGGVRNLMPLASILIGNDIKIAALLDGDHAGLSKGRDIKEKLLVDCIFVDSYVGRNGAVIEDMFPEACYLDAVKAAYPKIVFNFTSEEKNLPSISARLVSLFRRNGDEFEKWRPMNIIAEWIENPQSGHPLPDKTLDQFEALFRDVNKILG